MTFHSDPLGDFTLGWDKIKELHTSGNFAVLRQEREDTQQEESPPLSPLAHSKWQISQSPCTPKTPPTPAPIPVADAEFIMDKATLDKQLYHHPGFLKVGMEEQRPVHPSFRRPRISTRCPAARPGARCSHCQLAVAAQSHITGFHRLLRKNNGARVHNSHNTSNLRTCGGHQVRSLPRWRRT